MIPTPFVPRFRGAARNSANPPPPPPGCDAFEHRMALLQALNVRLRSAVRTGSAEATAASACRLQQVVLECSVDLDVLHRGLRADSARGRWLEEKTCSHRQFGAPANGQARIDGAR